PHAHSVNRRSATADKRRRMSDSELEGVVERPLRGVALRIVEARVEDEPLASHSPLDLDLEATGLTAVASPGDSLLEALAAAEQRARTVAERIEHVREELRLACAALSH